MTTALPEPTGRMTRLVRRQGWVVAVALLFTVLLLWRFSQLPEVNGFVVRTVVAGSLALVLLAMAQAIIVISGGIDLSVGAMLVLANVIAARFMEGRSLGECVLVAIGVLAVTVTLAALMGLVIAVSGIPDIVVTLAASFSYAGLALWILPGPGGGTSPGFQELLVGGLSDPLPSIAVIVLVLVILWIPLSRSRWGTAIYAIGSDRRAAFLAGVNVTRTRILAYAVGGFLSGMAGLVTTAFTGRGEPRESIGAAFTLSSVAAVVLGGVLLRGGVGGLLGPVLAALSLGLIPPLMLGLGADPAYAEIVRGVVIILVVMVGGLLTIRRGAT
jgi:ribose transport system permease protein